MARPVRPFKTKFAFLVRIVSRKIHFVRGGDVAGDGIVDSRQLLGLPSAGPLEASVAGHRQQAIPIGTNGRQSSNHPSDVAFHIGINQVGARRAPGLGCALKLIEVFGAHVAHRPVIGRHAGLQPGAAYGKGAVGWLVDINHRTMPGECEVNRYWSLTLDLDLFAHHPEWLPTVLILVLVRVVRVQLVDVEVLLVDGEDGVPEGDGVVVSRARYREALVRSRRSRAASVHRGERCSAGLAPNKRDADRWP